ncbi:hypothetical protein [Williamsia maris]|uniref:Uncharacterized protein n=1 Tax=Williamsia maris TaxID=72806 RepID=A0ABT1HCU7_9NOCA|nr:hypothetical protein [Williamsia maris]MCP2175496.1 hypothetical protein [Williamsia maris]
MNIKKVATSTMAAGFVGAALLGLGVSAGTASAAPQQGHSFQTQPRAQQPQQQRQITISRPDYRPFTYRGHRVTPRYDAAHRAWGFTYDRTFVHVVLARR